MNQTAVQKHSGDEAPPFVLDKNHVRVARSKAVLRRSDESPQQAHASAVTRSRRCHEAYAEHEDVAMRRIVVTGATLSPKTPENFLPRAAAEKRRLVPHSWHFVAWMPTRDPHAGQICGRG